MTPPVVFALQRCTDASSWHNHVGESIRLILGSNGVAVQVSVAGSPDPLSLRIKQMDRARIESGANRVARPETALRIHRDQIPSADCHVIVDFAAQRLD